MRIIKLGRREFPRLQEVHRFFEGELRSPRPKGRFAVPPHCLATDGLYPGERLLFAYRGNVLYTARAATGRRNASPTSRQPFYFCIDTATVTPVHSLSLRELEATLKRRASYPGSIVRARSWPRVQETAAVKKHWDRTEEARERTRLIARKYGPGGEGPDHKRLKEWLAANPANIGISDKSKVRVEHPFKSGDVVDVLFELDDGSDIVLEVETTNPLPGCHQAIKYRTLRCAQRWLPLSSPKVKAFLVAWHIPTDVRELCRCYDIKAFERRAPGQARRGRATRRKVAP